MSAGEQDGFLQRWSRRKQEAVRQSAAPAPTAPAASVPDGAAAARAQVDELVRRESEAQEREALLARLPKLEDLTAGSDFRQFMHPLVPAALRSAALARMWTLDPAIRDFVGPARDYAWDWNVPGGVPGGGPAPSLADVQSMLSRLTARLDAEVAREAGEEGGAPPSPEPAPAPAQPALPETVSVDPAASPAPNVEESRAFSPAASPGAAAVARAAGPIPAYASGVPRRRHGGAVPV